MDCKNCGKRLRASVTVTMYVDADDMYTITKRVINKKETKLSSKDFSKDEVFCPTCGWGS